MPATTLTAITTLKVILFCKTTVAFWSCIIVTFFWNNLFFICRHTTNVVSCYHMRILVSKIIFTKNYQGIALWPFIILKKSALKTNMVLINHEKIHLRQQTELLILPFYIWYTIEYLIKWSIYKNRNQAYYNLSFEREAYKNENNLEYLNQRKYWSFLKHL